MTSFLSITLGLVLHAGILLLAVMHYALVLVRARRESILTTAPRADDAGRRPVVSQWAFLPGLALVPLLRILDLTVPPPDLPFLLWYPASGTPLLIGAFLVARAIGWGPHEIGIRQAGLAQVGIALTGVPLALAGSAVLSPSPLAEVRGLPSLVAAVAFLMLFGGLAEELVFRGIVQRTLCPLFGPWGGIALTASLSAVANSGSRSVPSMVFTAASALLFGWFVSATGSILGTAIAHGTVNVAVGLVLPNL